MSLNTSSRYNLVTKSLNVSPRNPIKKFKKKNQSKTKLNPKKVHIKKENLRKKLDHILKLLNTKNKTQLDISKQNTTTNVTNNIKSNKILSKEKKNKNKVIKNLKLDLTQRKNIKNKSSSVEIFPNKRKKIIYYRNVYTPKKTEVFPSTSKNLTKEEIDNIISKTYCKKNNDIFINEDKIDDIYNKFFKNENKKLKMEKSPENLDAENITKSCIPLDLKESTISISLNGIDNINKFQETCKSNKTNNYSTTQPTAKDENSFIIKYFDKDALICDNSNNKTYKNRNYNTNYNLNYNKNHEDINYSLRNNLMKKIKILYNKNKNFDIRLNMASKNKIKNDRKEKLLNLIGNYDKRNKFIKGPKSYFRHWKYIKDEKK